MTCKDKASYEGILWVFATLYHDMKLATNLCEVRVVRDNWPLVRHLVCGIILVCIGYVSFRGRRLPTYVLSWLYPITSNICLLPRKETSNICLIMIISDHFQHMSPSAEGDFQHMSYHDYIRSLPTYVSFRGRRLPTYVLSWLYPWLYPTRRICRLARKETSNVCLIMIGHPRTKSCLEFSSCRTCQLKSSRYHPQLTQMGTNRKCTLLRS